MGFKHDDDYGRNKRVRTDCAPVELGSGCTDRSRQELGDLGDREEPQTLVEHKRSRPKIRHSPPRSTRSGRWMWRVLHHRVGGYHAEENDTVEAAVSLD